MKPAHRFVLLGLGVWVLTLPLIVPARADGDCGNFLLTSYAREDFGGHTYDGSSVWDLTDAVAASWEVPMGAHVSVDGLGEYTVHDRGGGLRYRHLDVLLDSHEEAVQFGVKRAYVCWSEE